MQVLFKRHSLALTVLLGLSLFFSKCAPTIAVYDQYAYTQATALKVDALRTMDKATEPYDSRINEVEELMSSLEKAYEYEVHRPKNSISAKMWSILVNPERNLLGGFLQRWKRESTLGKAFITEMKLQVAEGFDLIIELENRKIKDNDSRVTKFISANQ